MHVEAQIKWINIELSDIKRQQPKVEKVIERKSRPERAQFITYIQAVRDYVIYSISNPAEFKRTCQLLLSFEFTKQLEWMTANQIYIRAMEKFVLQSGRMLTSQFWSPVGDVPTPGGCSEAQTQVNISNFAPKSTHVFITIFSKPPLT